MTIEQLIFDALKYFSFFNYPPTLEEIYTFLKKKASKRQITGILEKMTKKNIVVVQNYDTFSSSSRKRGSSLKLLDLNENLLALSARFVEALARRAGRKLKISNSVLSHNSTPPQYIKRYYNAKNQNFKTVRQLFERQQVSVRKLNSLRFRTYLKILSIFPQIKLVGLSGSVTMFNAIEEDDIDLFVITAKNRLWTGRIIAILLAKLLGIHRHYHHNNIIIGQYNNSYENKVCLNLFFDAKDLKIPKKKQTDYVAHEVLQMKQVINKDNTYLSFIDANRWVFDIFPNLKNSKFEARSSKLKELNFFRISDFGFRIFADKIESFLKNIQLFIIRKHQTTELITDGQLWFHPDDFENKIKVNQ